MTNNERKLKLDWNGKDGRLELMDGPILQLSEAEALSGPSQASLLGYFVHIMPGDRRKWRKLRAFACILLDSFENFLGLVTRCFFYHLKLGVQ